MLNGYWIDTFIFHCGIELFASRRLPHIHTLFKAPHGRQWNRSGQIGGKAVSLIHGSLYDKKVPPSLAEIAGRLTCTYSDLFLCFYPKLFGIFSELIQVLCKLFTKRFCPNFGLTFRLVKLKAGSNCAVHFSLIIYQLVDQWDLCGIIKFCFPNLRSP